MTSKDRFGIQDFHARKAGGFVFEMSDNPQKDKFVDWDKSPFSFPGNGIVRMKPNGPTDFGVGPKLGKGTSTFVVAGGCGVKYSDLEGRGYMADKDDPRDVQCRCAFKINGSLGGHGMSISTCTGHHSKPEPCCQGNAYMVTFEPDKKTVRFRKEIWHIDYVPTPTDTEKTVPYDPSKFTGLAFCRYNTPGNEKKSVTLEIWFNPDVDNRISDWTKIETFVDKKGGHWGTSGDQCGGDPDQVLLWSGPQNRFKTNAGGGSIDFKMVSVVEIDPSGSSTGQPPGEPSPPPTTGTVSRDWTMKYNIIAFGDDACGVGTTTTFLAPFYTVTDNGSASNLHRDRYRACMMANGSASLFIGKKPKRVKVLLSKDGSPPTGDISVVLRKASDDEAAITFKYTGGPKLDAVDLTATKTQYIFEDLTANYVWQNGDKLCVEYSGNTDDTTNEVNVWRNTLNPFDGQASCAIKFEIGGPPPEGYGAPDTGRDYAWEISEVKSETDTA